MQIEGKRELKIKMCVCMSGSTHKVHVFSFCISCVPVLTMWITWLLDKLQETVTITVVQEGQDTVLTG